MYCAGVYDEENDWHYMPCTIAPLQPPQPPPQSSLDDIIELQTSDSSDMEIDEPDIISLDGSSIHAIPILESTHCIFHQ